MPIALSHASDFREDTKFRRRSEVDDVYTGRMGPKSPDHRSWAEGRLILDFLGQFRSSVGEKDCPRGRSSSCLGGSAVADLFA
jgi:hypothetical protein